MEDPAEALVRRLSTVCGLSSDKASQVVSELLDEMSATVNEYISARHEALQDQGWPNERIYRQIRTDLGRLRFSAPALSERQIRRRIYG